MSDLQDMLRVQARLHRKQGANALGDLFENANGEIETLRTQLVKANERVKELEQINLELAANVEACCELTEIDMGAAIDRIFEIDNTESKALLNKFAIEKKIEAYKLVLNEYGRSMHPDHKSSLGFLIEQLRKE